MAATPPSIHKHNKRYQKWQLSVWYNHRQKETEDWLLYLYSEPIDHNFIVCRLERSTTLITKWERLEQVPSESTSMSGRKVSQSPSKPRKDKLLLQIFKNYLRKFQGQENMKLTLRIKNMLRKCTEGLTIMQDLRKAFLNNWSNKRKTFQVWGSMSLSHKTMIRLDNGTPFWETNRRKKH